MKYEFKGKSGVFEIIEVELQESDKVFIFTIKHIRTDGLRNNIECPKNWALLRVFQTILELDNVV